MIFEAWLNFCTIRETYLLLRYIIIFNFIKSLKDIMKTIVPEKQKEVAELRKQYADKVIGQYTVDQVRAHT